MTSVFTCGFECGVLSSSSHWATGTDVSINTSIVRSGARSLRVNPNASSGGVTTSINPGSSNVRAYRFYVYFTTLPDIDFSIFAALGGCQFKQSDSKLYAATGGNLGATGVLITTGRWYRIDLRNDTSNNPRLCDMMVDGIACGQASVAAAGASQTTIQIGSSLSVTTDFYIDDIVVSNTLADYPIGNGNVFHFIPTSDGTHNVAGANDFEFSATGTDITNATTTAFTLIDDVPLKSGVVAEYINLIAPPNATDYVEVVFGPASGVPTPKYGPRAVEAILAYASASSGTNNLRIALNDNGTLDDTLNTTTGPGTTAVYARKHYSDPPSAATVWGIASGNGNFNNVRMRCFTNDAAPDPWWASAMIEAEFAEWPQKVTQVKQAVNRSNTY